MVREDRPPGFEEFDDRLRRLRGQSRKDEADADGGGRGRLAGHGVGLQAGVEIIGGVVGGCLIGWALDHWLGTAPWGLIVGFVLGAAGGLRNAYRRLSRAMGDEDHGSGGSKSA